MNPLERMTDHSIKSPGRRAFLKSSMLAGAAVSFPAVVTGEPNGAKLKIGLVGCGGRGSGAASNALKSDSNSELWAAADVSASQIDGSLASLTTAFTDRVNVPPARRHAGLDAYQKVIDECDVVLLCTPPGYRPLQLAAAIEAGRHVFCEKPMAVDGPGVRSVMESVRKSKEKGLSVVAGFCWRYCHSRREIFKAIHDGAIGEITGSYATYLTGPVKPMPPSSARDAKWSDVEWQIRNWYNFSWLSGDGYVEQCIHTVDKVAWPMKDQPPIACSATGGRQWPAEGGNIYDHMTVVYEYPNNIYCTVAQRQIPGCFNENSDYIHGTRGHAAIGRAVTLQNESRQRFREENDAMYSRNIANSSRQSARELR